MGDDPVRHAPGHPSNVELVVARRKVRLLTFTEEEAESMQAIGTGSAWTVALATLFSGALFNQAINMLLSGTSLRGEF